MTDKKQHLCDETKENPMTDNTEALEALERILKHGKFPDYPLYGEINASVDRETIRKALMQYQETPPKGD